MKEQVSALMDAQLSDPECNGCMARLKSDDELREAWDMYHLIGDALRGHTGAGLPAAFDERLAAEPTVLAPRPDATRQPRRSTTWYALSAAASVAAVAAVGWMALPLLNPSAPPAAVATVVAPPSAPPTMASTATPVPIAHGVGDYLLAHQRFSPSSAMAGMAPYARTVSEDGGRR